MQSPYPDKNLKLRPHFKIFKRGFLLAAVALFTSAKRNLLSVGATYSSFSYKSDKHFESLVVFPFLVVTDECTHYEVGCQNCEVGAGFWKKALIVLDVPSP